MTRSKRMKTIVSLADDKKDAAAMQYAQSQKKLDQSRQQLLEMKRCRTEYTAQLEVSGPGTAGVARTAGELQGVRTFIRQLDVAIQQLEHMVVNDEAVSQQQMDQWIKLRNKSRALTEIKDRYQRSEREVIENREQFESDELSQRKHSLKKTEKPAL